MQKRIMLVFLLITSSGGLFAEETVSASGHADGLGFLLEIESAPYYYEPSIDMNCLEIGGTAGVYIMVNPFVFGLTYNLACHYFVSPGPDSVIIDLSSGYRLPMGLKIHAKYFFNQYLNVSAGIGGIVNYSQLLWSSGVINYDSNFMRIDLGFFLDVGISFGLEWYDMQIRSEFYFPSTVIYAGIRNNFYPTGKQFAAFIELWAVSWNDPGRLPDPGIEDTLQSVYFLLKLGITVDLPVFTWGTPAGQPPEMENIGLVDTSKAAVQLEELQRAITGDIITFTNIIFYPDQASIKDISLPILGQIADFLLANPDVSIELRGYTNALGTPDQEQELAKARAEAVKAYMLKKGIASFRIVTVGYGSLFSKQDQVIEANRRVEIRILSRNIQK